MRKRNVPKASMVLHIYVCVRMCTSHSIKQMAGIQVREEQILRNKWDRGCRTKREQRGSHFGRGSEDKVTKRARKQKRRKLENDFTRERGGRL